MAVPRTPVSPGHFDRFNFCNAAPGFDLTIDSVVLGGVAQLPAPITINPMAIDQVSVCGAFLNADTFHISGKVSQGGVDTPFFVNYGVVQGTCLNNVVFGVIERCAGGATSCVLFGEVESTDLATSTTGWSALAGLD